MALICPCRLYMTWSVRWTSLCATYFSYAWPHCSYVVRVRTFCDILWPEVQSHCEHSPVYAPGPHSACICICALTQAHPTMSCIHLVPTLCRATGNVTHTLYNDTCTTVRGKHMGNLRYQYDPLPQWVWLWCHELWHHILMTSCRTRMALWMASLYSDRVVSWLLNATISHL